MPMSKAKGWLGLSLAVGLAIVLALVLWTGWSDIGKAFTLAGWSFAWLLPYYAAPTLCAAFSWRWLFARDAIPPFGLILRTTWIGLAINWLLPVAQVGGEVIRARLLILHRFPVPAAVASVTVDQTVQLATQFAYALIGLALMAVLSQHLGGVIAGIVGGLATLGILSYLFYRYSRRGMFEWLAAMAHKVLDNPKLAGAAKGASHVDEAVRDAYGRRRRLAIATAWRMGFRIALAGELWLALRLMGHPVGFADAVVLESLGQAARAAAFFVPGGLGVQEGAFMALAAALGLPTETGLALSLVRRVRELLVGVPGVLAWQLEETVLRRRRR